jgi:hypothetical protein
MQAPALPFGNAPRSGMAFRRTLISMSMASLETKNGASTLSLTITHARPAVVRCHAPGAAMVGKASNPHLGVTEKRSDAAYVRHIGGTKTPLECPLSSSITESSARVRRPIAC